MFDVHCISSCCFHCSGLFNGVDTLEHPPKNKMEGLEWRVEEKTVCTKRDSDLKPTGSSSIILGRQKQHNTSQIDSENSYITCNSGNRMA
jgi:hypothetical protein